MADTLFSTSEEREQFLQRLLPKKKKSTSDLEGSFFSDMYSSAAQGVGSMIQSVGTLVAGSESGVAQLGESVSDYWQANKSEKLKAQEGELSAVMQDESKGLLDAAGYVISNPYLAANMLSGSAPAMVVGMGAGGLIARGMASAGIMASNGLLTTMGTRVAGGVGEGLTLVPEVYTKTGGNTEAGLAALALSVATSIVTPGNLGEVAARKMAGGGVSDATLNFMNRSAARRAGTAVLGEGSQEFVQEGGQALLEQVGTRKEDGSLGDLDWAAAGKQAAVGAVLGGVMGGGLHPVVGEGDPLKAKIIAQERALADRRAAAEADPNNPVLAAEVAKSATELDITRIEAAVETTGSGPVREQLQKELEKKKLELTAKEARVAAERDPGNQNLQDAATTAEGAVVVALAEGDKSVISNAASRAVSAAAQGVMQADNVDSMITTFSTGNHASEVLRTATAGTIRTGEGVAQAMDEAFEADVEAGVQVEEFTPEQMQAKALKAEIESLRLRQQQAKTRQAETKLEREVETLRAQQKPEKKLETIEMIEQVGGEVSSDVMIREQAKAVPGGSFMVEENMDAPGQFDIIMPDGEVYDSYTSQQDADATAYRFNGLLDKEYARRQIARPDDFELDEARREIGSISNQLDGVLSFDPDGYPSEVEDALRVLDHGSNATPQQMRSALGVMSAYTNVAYHTGLMGANARDIITRYGNLNARASERINKLEGVGRPKAEETTLTEAPEAPPLINEAAMDTLQNLTAVASNERFFGRTQDESVDGAVLLLQDADNMTPPNRIADALNVLDTWGNRNLPSTDNRAWRVMSRTLREAVGVAPARSNVANEIRALAAEVETETAPAPRGARPRTEEGVRVVEQDFTRRAENAKRDGTLDKLSQFWRKIMRSKGQRTLPKIKMGDLVRPARTALARGEKIPQTVLTQIQDRYNAALKENARKWATENNQRFDESQWVDPIQGIIAYNDGASTPLPQNAGFSVELFPLNRGAGKNPYMVPAGARSANFSAGYSIHAVAIQNAKGAADLGYRLAAEIANLRGVPFHSDSVLLTVNNLRRQLQSMSADTLFAPGTISPLTRSGQGAGQGISETTWANMTDDQRIGLNALRAAHTISENRGQQGSIKTAARFIENLAYDRQGRIVAYRDPRTQNGFPRGTVVTDAMLDAKIGQIDPATGIKPFQADATHQGGVGLSTAKLGILNNTILREIEGDPEATIPTWVETVTRREGRKMNGWFFSETDTQAGGIDRDFATSAMNEMLGDTVTKILLDSGVVTFVDSQEDLTGNTFSDAAGNIQGATTPDGRIKLVLENLSPRSFSAVLQHEGLHSTLKALVGEKTYNGMMSRLETLVDAGQGATWAKDAEARVPSSTLPKNRAEEIAAYALEQYVKGEPETNPLVKWAKEFMSALRAGILKSKLMPEAVKLWAMKNLQPQDLSKLALAGLRQRAQQANLISRANGVRLSVAEAATPLRTAAQYQEEIDSLMTEHVMPETTRMRHAEINRKVAQLRTAWRVADEAEFARDRGLRLSVEEEVAVSTEPVAPPVPNEFNVLNLGARNPLARFVERLEKTLVDKHATINRIQRLAGITSEQIKLDTMGALDRLGSRLMTKQEDLVMKPLARMENLLNQGGWDGDSGREALDELLKAKHVAEYNAHVAEINPARYDDKGEHQGGYDAEHPGSGITDADAEATIKRLTSGDDAKTKALLEANDIYRQMIRDLQDYAVEQGLETRETIDNWNKKFPNYTPFNRDLNLSEDPSFGTVPGGQGFSLRAGLSRRAMGSSARIVSPLASTVLFGLKTTTRGENAEVGRTMLNFAREFTPKFRDENKEWKPMFKVNTVQTQRVVKYVNVYQVTKADGSLSREYYNREQARSFADAQQALWVATNPNANAPHTSGVGVQRIGDGPQARVVVQPIPNQLNQDNVMVIPENGKNVVIEFDKQSEDAMRVLAAFKGATTSKELNRMLMIPRMFSRWVQATATGFNPVFALFNSVRDIQSAMVTVGADKIPGWTAADSAEIALLFPKAAAQIWRQQGKEFRALHSNEAIDTTPEAGSFAEWQQDAAKRGGITGVRSSIFDAEDAETQIRRLFGQKMLDKYRSVNEASDWGSVAGGIAVKVGDAFARFGEGETSAPVLGWVSKNLVSAIARMNEAAELATRTVVFKKAVEKYEAAGKSPEEARTLAANISKNVSTNFNRRGAWSSTMNQLWPFFNAAMQGTARVAETLFEKQTYSVSKDGVVALDEKTKLSGYGKAVIASLATLGGLQAAVLALAGFEDDEPPQHVRDRNFIIPLFNGKGDYLMIPMPHGLNTMINFGRDMTQAMINPKKAGEHVANALWQLPNFNPFGGAGNVATDFTPAIVDPFLALYMNEDAFGRPIAKEDRNSGNPTPGFTRAKEGASTLGRTLARGLNMVSGGNDDRKGFISPTPDQIDFVMGQVTGGVGREIGKVALVVGQAVDTVAGRETEAMPSYKKPLIGRLVGSTQEPTAIRSKVFDIRQEINQTYAEYKGMRNRRETAEAREFWNAHPELALRDDFERAAKQDSKMRKSRAVARNAGEISSVNKMTNQQDERLLKLVGRYKELKGD